MKEIREELKQVIDDFEHCLSYSEPPENLTMQTNWKRWQDAIAKGRKLEALMEQPDKNESYIDPSCECGSPLGRCFCGGVKREPTSNPCELVELLLSDKQISDITDLNRWFDSPFTTDMNELWTCFHELIKAQLDACLPYMQGWVSVEKRLPENAREVWVSDGDKWGASYAVAFYRKSNNKWIASDDMLEAHNYDGGCSVQLDGKVKYWMDILPLPSPPVEEER